LPNLILKQQLQQEKCWYLNYTHKINLSFVGFSHFRLAFAVPRDIRPTQPSREREQRDGQEVDPISLLSNHVSEMLRANRTHKPSQVVWKT